VKFLLRDDLARFAKTCVTCVTASPRGGTIRAFGKHGARSAAPGRQTGLISSCQRPNIRKTRTPDTEPGDAAAASPPVTCVTPPAGESQTALRVSDQVGEREPYQSVAVYPPSTGMAIPVT
jgi:hypothetical protein